MQVYPRLTSSVAQDPDITTETTVLPRNAAGPTLSLPQALFLVIVLVSVFASGAVLCVLFGQPEALKTIKSMTPDVGRLMAQSAQTAQSALPFVFHGNAPAGYTSRFTSVEHATPVDMALQKLVKPNTQKLALIKDLEGRPDPFRPLVQEVDALAPPVEEEKKDVLDSVQFIGMIDDKKPSERVALIQVSDPLGGTKTAIKKSGESLVVDGSRIIIKEIQKSIMVLSVDGARRQMKLNPYFDQVLAKHVTEGVSSKSGADFKPSESGALKETIKKTVSPASNGKKPVLDDLSE
jgi:hypothetical protein